MANEKIEKSMVSPDNADYDPALILEASSDDDEDAIKGVSLRRDNNESTIKKISSNYIGNDQPKDKA